LIFYFWFFINTKNCSKIVKRNAVSLIYFKQIPNFFRPVLSDSANRSTIMLTFTLLKSRSNVYVTRDIYSFLISVFCLLFNLFREYKSETIIRTAPNTKNDMIFILVSELVIPKTKT